MEVLEAVLKEHDHGLTEIQYAVHELAVCVKDAQNYASVVRDRLDKPYELCVLVDMLGDVYDVVGVRV